MPAGKGFQMSMVVLKIAHNVTFAFNVANVSISKQEGLSSIFLLPF